MAGSHREVEDRVLKERGQDENTWDLMYMRKTKAEQGRAETTSVRQAYGRCRRPPEEGTFRGEKRRRDYASVKGTFNECSGGEVTRARSSEREEDRDGKKTQMKRSSGGQTAQDGT